MANYTKATNFASKDSLLTGNPSKLVRGSEIDSEFNAISTSIATKADTNSPTFTGTPTAPTASAATNSTQLATTAYVTTAVGNLSSTLGNMSTQNKNAVDITGGTIVGITDLAVADGGTGRSTLTANNVILGNGTSAVNFVAPSTSGNLLTSDGTTWVSSPAPTVLNLGTRQTASGTSVTFSGIPTTAKRITVIFDNVSTNGSSNFLIQIGNATVQTSGYSGYSSYTGSATGGASSTAGFIIFQGNAVNALSGHCTITQLGNNTYIQSHIFGVTSGSFSYQGGGSSPTITNGVNILTITTVGGTSTFDSGSINIMYE